MARLNPVIAEVTARIAERSRETRADYLERMAAAREAGPGRGHLSCGNLAHGFAAAPLGDKLRLRTEQAVNLGVVTAYNDMLSAHQPLGAFPELIKQAAREEQATAQVAGGVPAMCDGVTQGQPGMELSLFSRDVIALSTAVSLSHNMFDAALMLGVCDKIVPGLMIGALSFGHLPVLFAPGGPMPSGIPNKEKARVRELYAQGLADREQLLEAEAASYHTAGTCTFYGTANSNQMLMEVMGVHLPGSAFINPDTPLREAMTRATAKRAIALAREKRAPLAEVIDARAVVNGIVGLMATGGSTNHALHLPAMARAAGILIDWEDMDAISRATPLLTRIYPNGSADVNAFQAAGGMALLVRELLDAGLLHEDTVTAAGSLRPYAMEPWLDDGALAWRDPPAQSLDASILRPVSDPFDTEGGLRVLRGGLGRSVIKISAVEPQHRVVEAPAMVFHSQDDFLAAFKAGGLDRDLVAVVRFQGPRANGMPELHKLTPSLSVLQNKGFKVALVTDGRMSGASGRVPAAIHLTPEAAEGGPIARVRDGDLIRLDAEAGVLEVKVDPAEFAARAPVRHVQPQHGLGRELFAPFRAGVSAAEAGGSIFWGGRPAMSVAEVVCVGEIMRMAPVIPVLTVEDPGLAVPLAETLVGAGLRVLEVTLRTEKALEVIRRMTEVEGAVVGAGTVLNAADVAHAVDAGAAFLVSPGLTEGLVRAADDVATPLLPGVATAGEIMRGLDLGLIHFKFFPAETSGGAAAVKAFAGPFPHVAFCPTGGIRAKTAPDYLALPNVFCVGGTWIAPPDALAAQAWDRIADLARHAAALRPG